MPTLVVHTPDGTAVQHRVEGSPFVIGRLPESHLVLRDGGVSKRHCELVRVGERWSLRDLGSANGTAVNGIRAAETPLSTGDVLVIGPFRAVFQDDGAAEEAADDDATIVGGQRRTATFPALAPPPPATPAPARPVAQLGPSSYAPAPTPPAEVEVLSGTLAGRRFPVTSAGLSIGAQAGNDVVLEDPYASRRHARVEWTGAEYRVVDLGSTNGIQVDGAAVREASLRHGGRFQIGEVRFVLHRADAAGADAPPPVSRPLYTPPRPGAPLPGAAPAPPAAPEAPAGIRVEAGLDGRQRVRLGALSFTPAMAFLLGLTSLLMVGALGVAVWRNVAPMIGKEAQADGTALVKEAQVAYDAEQWDRALQVLDQVPPDDPRIREAEALRQSVVAERTNRERLDLVKLLLDQGVPEKARERFSEMPASSRYFGEARTLLTGWLQKAAGEAIAAGHAALAVDDIEGARSALELATRHDPEVPGLADLLAGIEERDAVLAKGLPSGRGTGAAGRVRGGTRGASASRSGAVEAVRKRYLGGDVEGARTELEGLMRGSDANMVAEAQEMLGRVERVERNLQNGMDALRRGDLDGADSRLREAVAGMTQLDPEWRSPRAREVRSKRIEQLLGLGRRAYQAGDHAAARTAWGEAARLEPGNTSVRKELSQLEEKAREIYARGYVAQKDGTAARNKEAAAWYKQVLAIAPQGSGFVYREKAEARLQELEQAGVSP
ncbi:FHA domain-containing protein [Myxococcota bacterium]|nr:FHA domain-containing protein [Myxococcota bacterium]